MLCVNYEVVSKCLSFSSFRGLWGGSVERVGDVHQKKQNMWLQVGIGDSHTAYCEETAKGHDTLPYDCWVQEVQNAYAALQEWWDTPYIYTPLV